MEKTLPGLKNNKLFNRKNSVKEAKRGGLMQGEMVTVPVDSLPEDWKKKHLVNVEEEEKKVMENIANSNTIDKRIAAVEVLKTFEQLKLITYIGIGMAWVSLATNFVIPYFSPVIVVAGTGIIAWFFIKQKNYAEHLQRTYRI
jgi:hypothetical protein